MNKIFAQKIFPLFLLRSMATFVYMVTISDPYNGTRFRTIYFDEVKAKENLIEKLRYEDTTVYGKIWKIEEGGEPVLIMETRGCHRHSPSHR
jgi:hypothetical protein